MSPVSLAALLGFFFLPALAQSSSSCSTTLTPTKSIKPSIASGYQAALVATGLTKPRSIEFDSAGNLLVVQAGAGIARLQLQDNGKSWGRKFQAQRKIRTRNWRKLPEHKGEIDPEHDTTRLQESIKIKVKGYK